MARGLGRSKGCQNCLKRKIKCDEKTPSCTQCTRGGRQCSGALSTVFLIVESETVNSNPTYRPRNSDKSPEVSHSGGPGRFVKRPKKNYQTAMKSSRRNIPVATVQPTEAALPPTTQSPQAIANQFLSHFITLFARVSPRQALFNSWLIALPDMLAEKSSLISQAIIAASMVYAGRDSGNTSTVMESYRWYGAGIEQQRKLLQEIQREKRMPTAEEICTPVLLSFFEISCNTSATGYFQHIMGAARLLEMRGPEACSSGILQQVYLTLRIQLMHPAIITRSPSIFSSKEWLTIPFQGRPKSAFDKVIDVITIISAMLFRLDATWSTKDMSEAIAERLLLRAQTLKIKEQLDQYWDKELRDASQLHGWSGDYYRGVPGFDFDDDYLKLEPTPTDDEITASQSPPPRNNGCFYAESMATAFYNTARMLTLSILNELDARPVRFEEQMQAHSESILCVATLMTHLNIGYAFVSLVLPLSLVWQLSPLEIQKIKAKQILSQWKMKGGVGGLCEVVLSSMRGETL